MVYPKRKGALATRKSPRNGRSSGEEPEPAPSEAGTEIQAEKKPPKGMCPADNTGVKSAVKGKPEKKKQPPKNEKMPAAQNTGVKPAISKPPHSQGSKAKKKRGYFLKKKAPGIAKPQGASVVTTYVQTNGPGSDWRVVSSVPSDRGQAFQFLPASNPPAATTPQHTKGLGSGRRVVSYVSDDRGGEALQFPPANDPAAPAVPEVPHLNPTFPYFPPPDCGTAAHAEPLQMPWAADAFGGVLPHRPHGGPRRVVSRPHGSHGPHVTVNMRPHGSRGPHVTVNMGPRGGPGGAGALLAGLQPIRGRNMNQWSYLDALRNMDMPVVVGVGAAGTGKTQLACAVGLEKLLAGEVNHMVVTRPAVAVGEELGFLPGDMKTKMEPWVRPIFDALHKHASVQAINKLMAERVLEVCPLGYMRGRTFESTWIVADELQNCSAGQMLMLLTRVGHGSKLMLTGDPQQTDRLGPGDNGLVDLLRRLRNNESQHVEVVRFAEGDAQRHAALPDLLRMYND